MLKESDEYDWAFGAATPSGVLSSVRAGLASLNEHPPPVQALKYESKQINICQCNTDSFSNKFLGKFYNLCISTLSLCFS